MSRPWRGEGRAKRPLVLPHAHISRIVDRQATMLVLTRPIRLTRVIAEPVAHAIQQAEYFEIHDALEIQRNEQCRADRRPDLQVDPLALTIEITSVLRRAFRDLDLVVALAAGFETTDERTAVEQMREELRDDWAATKPIGADRTVHVCNFHVVQGRFLHRLAYRGYTSNPSEAATGEPEALGPEELEQLAKDNGERYRDEHAAEFARREARSLANQLREAQLRAANRELDITPEVTAIRAQLDQIRAKLDVAA